MHVMAKTESTGPTEYYQRKYEPESLGDPNRSLKIISFFLALLAPVLAPIFLIIFIVLYRRSRSNVDKLGIILNALACLELTAFTMAAIGFSRNG